MNSSQFFTMSQFACRADMPSPVAHLSTTPAYSNGILYYEHDNYNYNNDDVDDDDDSDSSVASMETMSDNISVWVEGEKHWISGIDANTTCADLIMALVNYQDAHHLVPINQSAFTKEDNNSSVEKKLPDYVIVKQHRHCEEFLDSNAKVLDMLPARESSAKKEFELLLRRIETSPVSTTKNFPMDKDSGVGSPVGSSRSAKFRRKRHKVVNWLAQGNTLHPRSQKTSNDRLMKIILAQDETIHRQLSLLRDKDHQISKIEEENHKVREKELGKNYLLETYLNGLGEQDVSEEIFIDEPFHGITAGDKNNAIVKKLDDLSAGNPHDNNDDDDACEQRQEIKLKIIWMEKVITINKQLQKEEELLLKIFSKIRKYQVKRAYLTKKEMMQQITKIDSDIATQHSDIKQVESSLLDSNKQLKNKLHILENLSREFLEFDSQQLLPSDERSSHAAIQSPDVAATAEQFNKISPTKLQTPEDLLNLQKLIAKPLTTELGVNISSGNHRQNDFTTDCGALRDNDNGIRNSILVNKNTTPANSAGRSKNVQKQMFAAKCPSGDNSKPMMNITELGTLV